MELQFGGSQVVEVPKTVAAGTYQAGPSKVSEMARDGWLRRAHDSDNVPYTELPLEQQMQNAQAGGIGKGPKHQIDVCFSHLMLSVKETILTVLRSTQKRDAFRCIFCRAKRNVLLQPG